MQGLQDSEKMLKTAMEVGGSSYESLILLIEYTIRVLEADIAMQTIVHIL